MAAATVSTFLNHQVYVHKVYVDEQNLVVEALPPGSRFVENMIVIVDELVERDRIRPADEKTAQIIKEVANSVCPSTRMEVDYSSAHDSGWMPLLDIQVQIRNADGSVDWKFYKKEVSSSQFILNRSALPVSVKRQSLIQDGIRRLRNTRPSLVPELRQDLMKDLAEMMLISGYPESFRANVIIAALRGYANQVSASERGDTPLYRHRSWKENERRSRKNVKKASWFRPADTVIFVPSTPGA